MRFRLLPEKSHVGWTPYAWLVYLAFFVVFAVAGGGAWWWWAANGAGLALFLALYFRAYWLKGRSLLAAACAIVALGLLFLPFNPGAASFCIYGSAFVGTAVRPKLALRWLAGICVLIAVEAFVLGISPGAWVPAILFSLIVGGTNIHFAESGRADAKLRLAQEEVERVAKIAERERIARDLHDVLGHTLSVIVLKSELASKLAERDPARAIEEIRDVERISREALAEVRRAVQGYRAKSVDEEVASARVALASAGVELHADVASVDLTPLAESALSLALREAVTNVIRHASASNCWIRLVEEDGRVRLDVRDDGVGGAGPEGAGLDGMRARLRELAGTFERDGRDGTRILVSLPARRPGQRGAAGALS